MIILKWAPQKPFFSCKTTDPPLASSLPGGGRECLHDNASPFFLSILFSIDHHYAGVRQKRRGQSASGSPGEYIQ